MARSSTELEVAECCICIEYRHLPELQISNDPNSRHKPLQSVITKSVLHQAIFYNL